MKRHTAGKQLLLLVVKQIILHYKFSRWSNYETVVFLPQSTNRSTPTPWRDSAVKTDGVVMVMSQNFSHGQIWWQQIKTTKQHTKFYYTVFGWTDANKSEHWCHYKSTISPTGGHSAKEHIATLWQHKENEVFIMEQLQLKSSWKWMGGGLRFYLLIY